MIQTFLIIGGNLGDRFELLKQAKKNIRNKIGAIVTNSSVYETAPWGFNAEQNFLNRVLLVETDLSAADLLTTCLSIENELGRIRNSNQYESRTMDIDILLYGDEIINQSDLIVPHKRLHERKFTLEPLVEIAPDYIHPVFNKSLKELLIECKDNSEVLKL